MTCYAPERLAPASIDLMEWEGQKILDHVERLLTELPDPSHERRRLEALEDTLADAYAAAAWLREDIHLELRLEETRDLLDMLASASSDDGPSKDDPLGALFSARQKLSDALRDWSDSEGGKRTACLAMRCYG